MRLVFVGTPDVAVPSFQQLVENHDVVAVLTRPDAPQGRSGRLIPSPVAKLAEDRGIEVLRPVSTHDSCLLERIRQINPDCCPVVAYGGMITPDLLAVPRWGWINLHFSLLPAYRGAAPVQRALLAGESRTGLSVFRIVRALDAGPVFLRRPVDIHPHETAGDLLERLSVVGAEALNEALSDIESGSLPEDQSELGVSLAPKITTDEARLRPSMGCAHASNVIRAMSPDPGAWMVADGDRFKILRATPHIGVESDMEVGEIRSTKRELLLRLSDGVLELVEVQSAGKKPMSGADWARGAVKGRMYLD